MEIVKMTRKIKCRECGEIAKFKIMLNNTKLVLCEECVKELNRNLSKTTVPKPVATKFYLKR